MVEDDDAVSKGITDKDLARHLEPMQEPVGETILGMQAIPREEMRRMLAERKAKKANEELEALSGRHDTVPDDPPAAAVTPPSSPPPTDPSASGAYQRPEFDHSHDHVPHPEPPPTQVTGTIKVVETIWLALVRQGLGIVVLGCVLAGFHFGYLAPGPRIGGPDSDYLDTLNAKLDGQVAKFDEVCGSVPDLNVNALTAMQDKNNSALKALKIQERQHFMRLLHLYQDTMDQACAHGGKKWKKKWMRTAEDLLDEEEKEIEDED
jgi:hypothetical protein